MDGGRTSSDHLHDTGLQRPSGITIDYTTQRVFWVDVFNGRVESSNVDGSNRQEIVPAGGSMVLPFSLTLDGRVLYWTDWSSFSIYGTHGVPGDNVVVVYDGFGNLRPNSLEAVSPYRQYTGKGIPKLVREVTLYSYSSWRLNGQDCIYDRFGWLLSLIPHSYFEVPLKQYSSIANYFSPWNNIIAMFHIIICNPRLVVLASNLKQRNSDHATY